LEASSNWKSVGLVALGALLYSTLIIFTRAIQGLEAMQIAFFRAITAFLFFLFLSIWIREPLRIRQYRKQVPTLIALGLFMATTASLYIYAIQYTTAGNAALLVNTAPIYIAFLAPWLLHESRPRLGWISLALVTAGTVLVTGIGRIQIDGASLSGVIAGILSGFTYSFALMFSRKLSGKVSGFTQTFWSAGMTMLVLLPQGLKVPVDVVMTNLPLLFPLGIITLGLSSMTYFIALQKLKAQVVSVVSLLEPVGGVIIGWVLFHEALTLPALLGSVLILTGIYLVTR